MTHVIRAEETPLGPPQSGDGEEFGRVIPIRRIDAVRAGLTTSFRVIWGPRGLTLGPVSEWRRRQSSTRFRGCDSLLRVIVLPAR